MKRWFACFNELSVKPLCQTETDAEQRLRDFVSLLREIRGHTSVTKVRHADYMTSISLTDTMTMQDYCNAHINDPIAILLMSSFIHPQVDLDDDKSLQSYLDTTAAVNFPNGNSINGDGFNAAYCQNTFCVGFVSDPVWNDDFFNLTITSNGKSKVVTWACISSLQFYSSLQEHQHRRPAFEQWLQQLDPVELVSSNQDVENKPINIRDDHGKAELTAHAKLLCQNQYVEGVLTSLAFKPHAKNYIAKIYDDGTIDIVLRWEDEGFSMRVKTTGRNVLETREIAKILRIKFDR
jgi:hypothetical protein